MCICVRLSEDLTTIYVYTCVLPNVWRMRGKSQAGLRVSLLNVVKLAAFCFRCCCSWEKEMGREEGMLSQRRVQRCTKKKGICWADCCGICLSRLPNGTKDRLECTSSLCCLCRYFNTYIRKDKNVPFCSGTTMLKSRLCKLFLHLPNFVSLFVFCNYSPFLSP